MNLDQLGNLESKLEVSFPSQYRDLVISHPFPKSDSSDFELCSNYELLLQENRELRENGFFGREWNKSWFAIGFDGCGNEYFITTDPFDGRIYFADHEDEFHTEDLGKNVHYGSFQEYVDYLRELEEDTRRDELLMEERIKNRKWWQFWIPKQQ
ncbi:hypothetical protein NT6N_24760 [Oceaniferula spumae]|uniref:Knr4/Smi1-like domain-containing protein n=1 Tax=Oceaniferula spumae TaxID=2979115 RepID=A0AAT9FN45_9BACT